MRDLCGRDGESARLETRGVVIRGTTALEASRDVGELEATGSKSEGLDEGAVTLVLVRRTLTAEAGCKYAVEGRGEVVRGGIYIMVGAEDGVCGGEGEVRRIEGTAKFLADSRVLEPETVFCASALPSLAEDISNPTGVGFSAESGGSVGADAGSIDAQVDICAWLIHESEDAALSWDGRWDWDCAPSPELALSINNCMRGA